MKNLLKYKDYHAKIEISQEDNIFVGSVIGINDSLNFYGNTLNELQEAFESCIDGYLEMCEYYGKKPEKEYSGSFNVRIGSELHKKVDIMSQEQGISINQFIINTLNSSFCEKEKEFVYMVMPVEKSVSNFFKDFSMEGYSKNEPSPVLSSTSQEVTLQ